LGVKIAAGPIRPSPPRCGPPADRRTRR
jgi:hypothetical protein